MEQPPPTSGLGYYSGNFQPPIPSRPTSISAISITAIVLGSLYTLCGMAGAVMGIIMLVSSSLSDIMGRQAQYGTPALRVFNVVSSVVITALYAALLIGGIGGVQGKPWARRLLVKWAVAILVWVVLAVTVQAVLLALVPDAVINQQLHPNGRAVAQPFGPGAFRGIQIASVIFAGLLQCILPPFILVFWRRPYVIEAFEKPRPSFG